MKAVGELHQVEVEVPPQHIIIRPRCFLLFTLSLHHTFMLFSFPSLFLFFFGLPSVAACTPPPLRPPPSPLPPLPNPYSPPPAFVLLVPRHFLSLSTLFRICHLLKSFCLFPSSPLPPPRYLSRHLPIFSTQHLPAPHSASFSPWYLSNSPRGWSAVPLIACSFTLLFFPSWLFLPWQSDSCWSICH